MWKRVNDKEGIVRFGVSETREQHYIWETEKIF